MESHEVLRRAVEKIGAKKVAHAMRVSTSLVYKWCEPPREDVSDEASGTRNPLDRVLALIRSTEDVGLLHWLCNQGGGFLVANPVVRSESIDVEYVARTQRMIRNFADVLDAVSEAMEDDRKIDRREAARIRAEWEELKRIAEEFVCACERGLFVE